MSKVTIIDLVTDYEDADMNTCNKSRDIEVVPRKIVEMIIEKCSKDICTDYKSVAAIAEASLIKRYAESLLEQFEEEDV